MTRAFEPPAPAPGGDLAAAAAALGIDPSALEVPTGGLSGKPTVLMGWNTPADYAIPLEGLEVEGTGPGGKGTDLRGQPLNRGLGAQPDTSKRMDYDAAILDILKWSDSELETFKAAMVAAGRLDEDATRREVEAAWAMCVDDAVRWQAAGHDLTPWDMVGKYAGTGLDGDTRKPTVRKVVETSIGALLDQDSARSLLNNMLSNQLGRRATDVEIDNFQAALNEAQRKAPQVTTRVTTTDAEGNSTVRSEATGGFDHRAYAEGYVHEDENLEREYGDYQAATTYMDALMQAAQAPVNY